jgi:AraC-like DNA-binding protein
MPVRASAPGHPELALGGRAGRVRGDDVVVAAAQLELHGRAGLRPREVAARERGVEPGPTGRDPARRRDRARPRATEYLREHLADAVPLDDLAVHAGLDKYHLCRAFRVQIGLPPRACLTGLRIARAKELLRRGVRASEVAPRVGIYDQAQLTRHFRRPVGTTPARYPNCQHAVRHSEPRVYRAGREAEARG